MWHCSISLRRVLVGSALLVASNLTFSVARAQERDEAWVIAQITAGNFDELRSLEKLSNNGVPFAMYWWGTFLHRCIFDRCDEQAARALYLRAAKGGHGGAQAVLFSLVKSSAELAALTADIGMPAGGRARVNYAMQLLLSGPFSVGDTSKKADPKAIADFVALASAERRLGMLVGLVALEGVLHRGDELRAIANSGYIGASEMVMGAELMRGVRGSQLLERARTELGVGAAYCATIRVSQGYDVLPANIIDICERAAKAGFPGAVQALVRHHHHSGNKRATEYFIGVCSALVGIRCAGEIADYYESRRNESAELAMKWELWDLASVIGVPGGVSADQLNRMNERIKRTVYTVLVRTDLIEDACFTQRLDPATGAVEANPQCPWRRPIAIPSEFLSAK